MLGYFFTSMVSRVGVWLKIDLAPARLLVNLHSNIVVE